MVARTPLRDSAAVLLASTSGVAPLSWVSEFTAAGPASKEEEAGVVAAALPAALLAAAKHQPSGMQWSRKQRQPCYGSSDDHTNLVT